MCGCGLKPNFASSPALSIIRAKPAIVFLRTVSNQMNYQPRFYPSVPLCRTGGRRMSNWQAEQAERNRKSLARLSKALPAIFPPAVLERALSRPFIPPTPRLAIDSYWRAHPIRADRLARALAARSGALKGWTWQLGHNR